MHGADACGRNEGDDVSAAQAEAVDNCQTTTSLPSTRKLDFFPEAPNMAKFVHIFFKENSREILCVFVRQHMIPCTGRTPSVNHALHTFF